MPYDTDIHHRRSIRLKGYDYSQPGAYFVTICTHERALLLQADGAKKPVLRAWRDLPSWFPSISLDEFVIMPNHVHGILILEGAASSAPTLGQVVRTFKSVSGIAANKALGRSGQPFWQRNYYEHIVRDEDELDRIREYVRHNPLKWDEDPDNPLNL